ncbi:MAG TPA: M56 family metallopeptidase [Bacteroidales bacterium]|nr:M56 family metallopeptidase [Bacteroidales bacterium]HRZ75784.1 M56 family metallopeptidase [Bacteroidales bacterium]
MNTFLLIQLHAGLLIALAWILYRTLLRDRGYFSLGRAFLLLSIPLAYGLPLWAGRVQSPAPALLHYELPMAVLGEEGAGAMARMLPEPVMMIYLLGAGAWLTFHLWNLFRILSLMQRSRPSTAWPGLALDHPHIRGTYAFLHRVIWNERQLSLEEQEVILRHERVHIRQAHTADILFLEWITVLQWFNPFIYLLRRDLLEVHEFLADRGSLGSEGNVSTYLRVMLDRALGKEAGTLSNAFGNVSLKRRIMMMNKSVRRENLTRYVLAFVLFASAALMAARPEPGRSQASAVSGIILDTEAELLSRNPQDKPFKEVKSMPEYVGGTEAMMKFLQANIRYPEEARKQGKTGTVYVMFKVNEKGRMEDLKVEKGIGGGCDEEALRVVKMMTDWKPALDKEGKPVTAMLTLPVKFQLSDKKKE